MFLTKNFLITTFNNLEVETRNVYVGNVQEVYLKYVNNGAKLN